MGHDPHEKAMPKAAAAPNRGPADVMDKFRFQGPAAGQDEIHIHDDKLNLVFVWNGSRSFRIHWQMALQKLSNLLDGEKLAIIGEVADHGSRKAGVLVFENIEGSIEMVMEEYDKQSVYDEELRKQSVIEWVDDFVERRC